MALQGVTLHLTAPGLQHLLRFPAFEVAKNFLLCSGCLFFKKKKKKYPAPFLCFLSFRITSLLKVKSKCEQRLFRPGSVPSQDWQAFLNLIFSTFYLPDCLHDIFNADV